MSCADTSECPEGFVCKQSIASCVRVGSDDTVPEVVSGSITPTSQYVREGGTAVVSFAVSKEMAPPPDVRLQWSGTVSTERSMQQASRDVAARSYTYTYVAAPGDPQDWATIVIRLVDDNGNQGRGELTRSVRFDFESPNVATDTAGASLVSVQYLPAADNLRRDVSAATTGTTVRVAFTVQEELSADPIVQASSGTSFALKSHSGLSYVYETVWSSTAPEEAAHAVVATLSDLAGNVVDVELAMLDVDTIPPAAPAVATPDAIVFERLPWGSETSNGRPTFTLSGAAGATVGAAEVVVFADTEVFDATGGYVGREITRIAPRADGGFGGGLASASPFSLPMSDRASVYVLTVDAAGNPSDAAGAAGVQASQVRDVAWTATLIGKVPGSTLQNPHGFEVRRVLGTALKQGDSVPLAQIGSVARQDADVATTNGAGSWRHMTAGQPGLRSDIALAYDSLRQRYVLWGGYGYFTCDGSASCGLWEGRGLRWSPVSTSDPEGDGDPARAPGFVSTFDSIRGVTVVFRSGTLWEWNGTSWRNGTPATMPTPAPPSGVQLAFDRAHRRTLLFGGGTSTLWAYDGTQVTVLCDATSCGTAPAPRLGHAIAYDDAREALIVFGGSTVAGVQSDTWEWKDGQWAQRCVTGCPSGSPAARTDHRMAYDSARGVIVLVGGQLASTCGGDPCAPRDTWEWNGSEWLPACAGTCTLSAPDARRGHGLVFDVERQRIVLGFGSPVPGASQCDGLPIGLCDGLWEWDGAAWTRLNDYVSQPAAMTGTAVATDPATQSVLLFGGAASGSSRCWSGAPSLNNTTWRWNGERWLQLAPATSPAARCGHAMGAVSGVGVVVFGGVTGAATDGTTWVWNGTTWTRRCENVPVGDTCLAVAARQGGALATTPAGNRLMLFGGSSDTDVAAVTPVNTDYLWTPPWSTTCTSGSCVASRPTTRIGSPLAYDALNGVNVMFGGADSANPVQDDTWRYNGTTWSLVMVSRPTPPERAYHGLVYAPDRRATVLFGGSFVGPILELPTCTGSSNVCDDTWELVGTQWTERAPADPDADGKPTAAFSVTEPFATPMAFEPLSGDLLMFNSRAGETWLYSTGGASRPAHVFAAVFDAAQADAASVITDLEVVWNGGGSGSPNGVATPGATLLVWSTDHWEALATDDAASPGSPASVRWRMGADPSWASSSEGQRRGLFVGEPDSAYFALAPKAVGGSASNLGAVVSDYVEVTVRYRAP